MKHPAALALVFWLSVWSGMAGAQQAAPLTQAELSACAALVQLLRRESARLNTLATQANTTRQALAASHAQLEPNDGSTQAAQRWLEYNSRASAFNEHMAGFRADVSAVNATKAAYTRQCANRPYSQALLDELTPAEQAAMREGLNGVQVPYINKPR